MTSARAPLALRSLAALLRAGMPLGSALVVWADYAPEDLREDLSVCARRVALGDAPANALASMTSLFGDHAAGIGGVAALHATAGCDAAQLLEATAASIERRAALQTNASAASAGTKLSGKIVAALPLMVVPLVPAAGASLLDRRGTLLLVLGAALLFGGAAWIRRLMPSPPGRDEVAELADLVAAAARAGVSLDAAFQLCSTAVDGKLRTELESCARRVRLGLSWSGSLAISASYGLQRMAVVIARAERLGSPVADVLRAFSAQRGNEAQSRFDEAARRAPVLMVLPLTICILPAYVVLAIGPILRGLSPG